MRVDSSIIFYKEIEKLLAYLKSRVPSRDFSVQDKFNKHGEYELAIEEIALIITDSELKINFDIFKSVVSLALVLNQMNNIDTKKLMDLVADDA